MSRPHAKASGTKRQRQPSADISHSLHNDPEHERASSKRARPDVLPTEPDQLNGAPSATHDMGNTSRSQSKRNETFTNDTGIRSSRGHGYHGTSVADNGQLHQGDRFFCGPNASVNGPGYVSGPVTYIHTYQAASGQSTSQLQTQENVVLEIKKRLHFEQMDRRQYQLNQVDQASLEWIWTDTTFPQWLEQSDGWFHIQGKPASGKSSLMNYLVGQARGRVIETLKKLSADPLLLHFFFDFRAASGIANDIVGLLRSLLLQTMDKFDAVKQYLIQQCAHRMQGPWAEFPTPLMELLQESLKRINSTVCCFLDGLDEYGGDLNQLRRTIIQLKSLPNLKICIASRPRPELSFVLSFDPLVMQNHNSETIQALAEANLSHVRVSLEEHHGVHICVSEMEILVEHVVCRAEGVILWADFAVEEMAKSLQNGDSIREALQVLDMYPSDLIDIYTKHLSKLDEKRRREAGVILFLITYWDESFGERSRMPLSDSTLCGAFRRIMHDVFKVDPCTEADVPRFRLRVRNTLGDLVTFVQGKCFEPRLLHKSLDKYVRKSGGTDLFHDAITEIFDMKLIGPQFLIRNLLTASSLLRSDDLLPCGPYECIEYGELPDSAFQDQIDNPVPFTIGLLEYGVSLEEFSCFHSSRANARQLLVATRARIFRHSSARKISRFACHYTAKEKILHAPAEEAYPQIFDLIFWAQWRAFEMALDEDLRDVPEETKTWLRGKLMDRVYYWTWSAEESNSLNYALHDLCFSDLPSSYFEGYAAYKELRSKGISDNGSGADSNSTSVADDIESLESCTSDDE